MPLLLATANPHKVTELRAIFAGAGIEVVGLHDVPGGRDIPEPRESGDTFTANAGIKALAYASATRLLCVADDSGLEVDALGGRPGVISSHYSTGGRETGLSRAERDAANNALLLRELASVPAEHRTARFVCVMALAVPGGGEGEAEGEGEGEGEGARELKIAGTPPSEARSPRIVFTARGTFEGRIGVPPEVPRGKNGFGYDPLLLLPSPDDRTSAELSSEEKNARSHRGQAARLIADFVRKHSEVLLPGRG